MPKRAVDLPAKAFLPGRRPQGPKQQSSQYSTSTSARSQTRTFRLCLHQRFQNHNHLRNRGAKHCVCNAKKELDRGPLTTPKPPLALYCPSETTSPSETKGLTISEAASIILQALHTQCKEELDQGPLTTPKPLIAPPLAPLTPAENSGPSETAVRSDHGGGGAVAATAQRLRLHNHAIFTQFLPRCTYHFLPLRVKAG